MVDLRQGELLEICGIAHGHIDPGNPRDRRVEIIEGLFHHGRGEPGADAGVFYRRVTTQSVLDRYLSRSQIDPRQFDVGTKLYRMWRAAGGEQRVTFSYEPRVRGRPELSDEQAVLRHRLTEVLRRMGPLSGILIRVCLCDEAARDWATSRGDAPQAGVVVLRLALDALADYWKI